MVKNKDLKKIIDENIENVLFLTVIFHLSCILISNLNISTVHPLSILFLTMIDLVANTINNGSFFAIGFSCFFLFNLIFVAKVAFHGYTWEKIGGVIALLMIPYYMFAINLLIGPPLY